MIQLNRETVGALVAAGHALLPTLLAYNRDGAAWSLSEALRQAEVGLLDDEREEDAVLSAPGQ